MTTNTPALDVKPGAGFRIPALCPYNHAHAPDHVRYCSHCRDMASVLPKLKQPSWVQLIKAVVREEAPKIAHDHLSKQERKKRAKANHKAYLRMRRAWRGEFTRSRRLTLRPA